jgi:glycosyltransferase involved in cell wall biosynthesis
MFFNTGFIQGGFVAELYPKISIVTPSYNQGEYLEETILSVLDQGYPDLEYIIIDGGSTDNSVDIIKKYEKHLTYWVSEPDQGMYHALNKGFSISSGQIMAWINSSDLYCPWALSIVADVFCQLSEVKWLTSGFPMVWDEKSRAIKCKEIAGFSQQSFLDGRHLNVLPNFLWVIQQESTFWRRSLWKKTGGTLSTEFKSAGDFELWSRFFQYTDLYTLGTTLGGFRKHADQKSSDHALYWSEAVDAFETHGISDYAQEYLDILKSSRYGKRKIIKQLSNAKEYYRKLSGARQTDTYTFKNIVVSKKEDPVKWKVKRRKVAFSKGDKELVHG